MNKDWRLYVLKLEQGKYYVGITTQTVEARFKEHLAKRRAAYWTMMYKPLKILDVHELGMVPKEQAEEYENKVTRKYMKEKGLNNVRGGKLTDAEDYRVRFGYIMKDWDWYTVTVVALLMACNIALFVAYQLK